MQNQHVTPFSSNRGEQQGVYAGVPQESAHGTFAIDPSLDSAWVSQQQDPHQYGQPRYAATPQYYLPYGSQQAPQQPVFQNLYGNSALSQNDAYSSYQPQVNQYSDPFFASNASQHAFTNAYGFSTQPSQQQTISPQALQVEDHMVNDVVPQNAFNQRAMSHQQPFGHNAQQDRWAHDQPMVDSSHFSHSMNVQVVPKSMSSLNSTKPLIRGDGFSSYSTTSLDRSSNISSSGFDSGFGQASSTPATKLSVNVPRTNPLRETKGKLIKEYPSEDDAAHRVPKVSFAVLGETAIEVDLRGKTTIPKYHGRGNSMGKNFAPRTDLFATTRSAKPAVKKIRSVKVKKLTTTSKGLGKGALLKITKARLGGNNVSVKQGSPATPSLASSSSQESSSEESEEESEEEEEMCRVLYQDVRERYRPTDPAGAAKWDATTIVFVEGVQHDINSIDKEVVVKAVQEYERLILKLRDSYRASITACEEARPSQKQELLKAKDSHHQALVNALRSALDYGHREIVKNLGNSAKTFVALWNILKGFVAAEDFTNELPVTVLELMRKFTGLEEGMLKKIKFENLQKRIMRKGTDQMKDMIAAIARNATEEGKLEMEKHASDPAPPKPQRAAIQPPSQSAAPAPARTTGIKRPHEGEGANGNPAKKIASGAASIPAPRQPTSSGTTAAKSAPRPSTSNVFATLTRSAKPPQTANGSNNAVAKTTTPAKPVAKPAPQMTSKFGDLLASINAPKEVPKAPSVPEGPPETPEEKKRRERKESRRHLRVKWKEGDELTQIKLFTQVEGENEGRKDELVRDAHDDRSEGMMHKQRAQEEVDIDEDDTSGEIEYRPYPELIPVDFSEIEDEQRAKSYVTRGGLQNFSTMQQEIQNRHESTELMVVYTDPSDIPHSAKEPPNLNDEAREEKPLVQPEVEWLQQRIQDARAYGVNIALDFAVARRRSQKTNTSNQQFAPTATQPYQSHPGQKSAMSSNASPEQMAEAQALIAKLTATLALIMGKPFPSIEPPDWMNESRKTEWWEGYNRDNVGKATAQYNPSAQQSQMQQAAMMQPQMQPHQQAASQIQPAAFDLQSWMRNVNITTAQDQPAVMAPSQIPFAGYDLQNYVQHLSNPATQATQQQPQQAFMNGMYANGFANPQGNQNWMQGQNWGSDNNMQWERDDNSNAHNGAQYNAGLRGGGHRDDTRGADGGPNRKGKNQKGPGQTPALAYKQGTKPCRYFADGKCAKGPSCTYRHDPPGR